MRSTLVGFVRVFAAFIKLPCLDVIAMRKSAFAAPPERRAPRGAVPNARSMRTALQIKCASKVYAFGLSCPVSKMPASNPLKLVSVASACSARKTATAISIKDASLELVSVVMAYVYT